MKKIAIATMLAAAEEYRDFITALATNYGDGLILSAVIEDSQ